MAVGLYDLMNGALVLRKSAELDVFGASTLVSELSGEKVADMLLINDRDLSYGKIRFDERSLETLKSHLGDIQDPLARALCWSATWDMLRDGELAASNYVPMAIKALAGESDVAVVSMTLSQLDTSVELYASDAHRQALREVLANGIEQLLASAPAGSDMQLQYARSFASTAQTPAQNARIQGLLDGELAGLVIDADLRWHFLGTLAERNLATVTAIDAELVRDNTANGQRYAAFCKSAFPDSVVKEKAFDSAINGGLSNHIQVQTIRGFQRPAHRALLTGFVDKYFSIIADVWSTQSYETASNIVQGLFPIYVTSAQTLDTTEKWLSGAGKDAPSSLRRIVSESRDAMARALKAQAKDAS